MKKSICSPQKMRLSSMGVKVANLFFEDNAKNLWLLPTEGNFCYYDRKERTLKPLLTDINNPKSIFSPLVRSYTLDNQGKLLVCNSTWCRETMLLSTELSI